MISSDELSALALAADPDTEVPDDAVPFDLSEGEEARLLPAWYFPVPAGRQVRGWRRRMVLLVAGSFLLVSACGLCCTYGALAMA